MLFWINLHRLEDLVPFFALFSLMATALWAESPRTTSPKPTYATSSLPLPSALHRVNDLRWESSNEVVFALRADGASRWHFRTPSTGLQQIWSTPSHEAQTHHLGRSESFLVAASWGRNLRVRDTASGIDTFYNGPEIVADRYFDWLLDIDVFKNRLLVLGAMRSPTAFSPNGEIAWVGSLDTGLKDWKNVLTSQDGAAGLDHCGGGKGLGKVRFLPDGSYLIAPVVEPGLILFSAQDMRQTTWDTTALRLDHGCDIEPGPVLKRFDAEPEFRRTWINSRRLVDEILPTVPPTAVVRNFREGRTRWTLLTLAEKPHEIELPITSDSPKAHLRGDLHDGKLALLIFDIPPTPGRAHELVLLDWPLTRAGESTTDTVTLGERP